MAFTYQMKRALQDGACILVKVLKMKKYTSAEDFKECYDPKTIETHYLDTYDYAWNGIATKKRACFFPQTGKYLYGDSHLSEADTGQSDVGVKKGKQQMKNMKQGKHEQIQSKHGVDKKKVNKVMEKAKAHKKAKDKCKLKEHSGGKYNNQEKDKDEGKDKIQSKKSKHTNAQGKQKQEEQDRNDSVEDEISELEWKISQQEKELT